MTTVEAAGWAARHFDGETPVARNVVIGLMPGTLIVDGERHWSLEDVVILNEGGRGGPAELELRGERTEKLIVTDPAFLAALQAASGTPVKRHGTSPVTLRVVLGLTIAAVAVLFAVWRWGVPALAAQVAKGIPVSWERALGGAVMDDFASDSVRVDDPAILRPVEDAFARVLTALPGAHDPYQAVVIRSGEVNAYAVPGGYVVVTTALLRTLEGPDELAAVLGHEITHLAERHTTRGLIEQGGLALLFSLMSGGDSGLGRLVGKAGELGQLSYSRDDEAEADAGAAALLARAGISPLALASTFDRLSAASRGTRLEFLSTHPADASRREHALELARTLHVAPASAPLDTESWRAMDQALATSAEPEER